MAYRATETPSEGFGDALAELRRERLVTQIDVGGLDRARDGRLVRLRTGGSPVAAVRRSALHAETEGNPFFIEEIVRHLADAGVRADAAGAGELQRFGLPEGVKRGDLAPAGRLDRRDDRVAARGRGDRPRLRRRAARAACSARRGASSSTRSTRRWRPGWWSRRPASGPLQLLARADPRDAVRGDVGAAPGAHPPPGRRGARGRRRRDGVSALALHFTRAAGPQDAEKAIAYALRAGEQATAMLAHEEAAEHYARALEVLERFEPDALAAAAS